MNDDINRIQREGLSIAEACAMAGIGKTKIYQAISDGNLKARKFGKRRIILRDDLRAFLAALPTAAPATRPPSMRSLTNCAFTVLSRAKTSPWFSVGSTSATSK